jgi:hypothetical protein
MLDLIDSGVFYKGQYCRGFARDNTSEMWFEFETTAK